MPFEELPLARTFTIENFQVIDGRRAPSRALAQEVRQAWRQHVRPMFVDRGFDDTEFLCDEDTLEKVRERDQEFAEALLADPTLNRDEWDRRDTRRRTTDFDASRPSLFFAIRNVNTGNIVGGLSLTHMNVERVAPQQFTARGVVVVPGVPPGRNVNVQAARFAAIYRYLLSNPIREAGGERTLDILSAVFVMLVPNDPLSIALKADLEVDFNVRGDVTDNFMVFKRRGQTIPDDEEEFDPNEPKRIASIRRI